MALMGILPSDSDLSPNWGSVLDPLADKLLLLSAFVMLTLAGDLPFWLLIIAAFRDLVIVTGVVILTILYNHFEMKPIWSSKVNTFLQILLVIALLVEKAGIVHLAGFTQILIWLVAFTILLSGFQYVIEWGIGNKQYVQKSSRQ